MVEAELEEELLLEYYLFTWLICFVLTHLLTEASLCCTLPLNTSHQHKTTAVTFFLKQLI